MSEFRQPDGSGESLNVKIREMIRRISPQDLFSASYHSKDFRNSRAEYISVRIRMLAFLFAVLAPLWIPVDYLVMDDTHFYPVLGLRIGFSLLLVLLGLWSSNCNRLNAARARVALFLIVPGLFYVASHAVLNGDLANQDLLVGYSFMPFLMVALLAVVPLTLVEGVALITLSSSFFIASELYYGTLFTIPTLGSLWFLSLLAAIAIWVELTQLHMLMGLYREATRDALTGLVNRRILYRWLKQEVANREESDGNVSVLLFDLDLFKRVNDTYGHLTGDLVLQSFARLLQATLPEGSMIGRYGGEEFLAILPGTGADQAREAAEAVREACHRTVVRSVDNGEPINFTTSIGVAQRQPGEDSEALLSRVDQSLYAAKESGRDLVAVAT